MWAWRAAVPARPGRPPARPAAASWPDGLCLSACRVNAVRFARGIAQTGAPGEIRTPDPQIRSLEVASLEPIKRSVANRRAILRPYRVEKS